MGLEAFPLHPLFGAELRGVDFAEPDAAVFEREIGRWGLVLVRAAALDDGGLARFAGRFGPLQNMSSQPEVRREVIRVSNLADDGQLKSAEDPTRRQHDANRLWHMDSSFLAPGATYSFLHARIVPDLGGDTEFLDARVGWEALGPDRQRELLGLTTEHSILHSLRQVGVEPPDQSPTRTAPVARKLVRRHAPSGRLALIIPSHVERIAGLDYEAGQALLAELTAIASTPRRIYRHRWKAGDLLVWDNRCMLHRSTPYRAFDDPRDLNSCRVVDVDDDGLADQGLGSAASGAR
ncbi:TauD/TfdA family dioxygenase [Phenylobacterium sp. LjRoot219]|uniref:TauD/TfdA dioxygenase family protein n=1 Tax=Phenylobacterium sp. LjRoot219 TaxID=3342283 RepID=UPI003ED0A62B